MLLVVTAGVVAEEDVAVFDDVFVAVCDAVVVFVVATGVGCGVTRGLQISPPHSVLHRHGQSASLVQKVAFV